MPRNERRDRPLTSHSRDVCKSARRTVPCHSDFDGGADGDASREHCVWRRLASRGVAVLQRPSSRAFRRASLGAANQHATVTVPDSPPSRPLGKARKSGSACQTRSPPRPGPVCCAAPDSLKAAKYRRKHACWSGALKASRTAASRLRHSRTAATAATTTPHVRVLQVAGSVAPGRKRNKKAKWLRAA